MLNENERAFAEAYLDFYPKLGEDEKAKLWQAMTKARFPKGVSVRSRDSECLGVLLVHSGSLRAYIQSDDGREVTLYRLGPGEVCILSASCVLNSLDFEVSIDSDRDTEVFKIAIGAFNELMAANVWVENFSYKSAVARFADVMWAVEQVLFMRFDKRLAIFLLDESAKTGTVDSTHEEIAKYVGSAREVVSRMLKTFESQGLVELSRGSIRILNRDTLKKLLM
jgi:CRP/FNR family transcriptional regulator